MTGGVGESPEAVVADAWRHDDPAWRVLASSIAASGWEAP